MKRFIKVFSAFLCLVLLMSAFTACSKVKDPTEKKVKFGIILQIENGAFTDMRDGIVQELKDAGYTDENSEIVIKCAQGDATMLSTIASEMANGDYTAVFTIATAATQAFVNQESDTPCFFCAVSDPLAAKVVSDFEKPDKNATGTSNAVPVSDIFALSDRLTPGMEKYGIIYCTSQTNAVSTANAAKKFLGEDKYVEKAITDATEVKTAVEALIESGVDAIFVPNDQIVQSAISSLTELCLENKIPTYCSSATTVASGCFATIAIDDIGIGKKTAKMALEYLKNGKKISEIPTVVVGIDYCSVNEKVRAALDVEIPEDLGYSVQYLGK